jgi:hypothetical protein
VNPAASSHLQRESRADHVAAKAMSGASAFRPVLPPGLLGVRGAARAHGSMRNRRDPSWPPASGKDRSYKPMVKSRGVKRESEGVIVLLTGVQQNTSRGKDPCFGRAVDEGKREGMAGTARPNNPARRLSGVKVREPHERLWATAKHQPGRRISAQRHSDQLTTGRRRRCVRSLGDVHAALGRPSASRVRENRTHGLRGGGWNQAR